MGSIYRVSRIFIMKYETKYGIFKLIQSQQLYTTQEAGMMSSIFSFPNSNDVESIGKITPFPEAP
jgi:hypothetical protein